MMTVLQEVATRRVEIFLPYNLKTKVTSQDGTTYFSFEPAISTAFHTVFLMEYFDAVSHSLRTMLWERSDKKSPHQLLETSGLELAIHDMLRQTLPDFFGEEQFYRRGSVDFNRRDFDLDTSSPGMSFYHKIDERNSDSFVNVWFRSPENLKPTMKDDSLGNPFISGGYMQGYVKIHPKISKPSEKYATFGEKDVFPILKALLTGEDIDLLEPVPRGYPKVVSCEYAHIEHPTVERMKAAIGYAAQISEFFMDNEPRLQEIATHVLSVRKQYVRRMYELREAYRNLISEHELAESLVRQKLSKPAGIDDTLAAIEVAMQKSLEPANAELRAMSRDFPTVLASYLPQTKHQLELFARSLLM